MVSIKRNTISTFAGVGYVNLIGIIVLPLYLKYLGSEAYGLVGIYAVIHSWLILLDMGMSGTLSRIIAEARGKGEQAIVEIRKLLRSIEIIFLIVGLLVSCVIWITSSWVTNNWLGVGALPHEQVQACISIMGVIFLLRWFSSFYRSGLKGLEKMVWLNTIDILIASIRYFGTLTFLVFISTNPLHFFELQLVVGLVEFGIVAVSLYSQLPDPGRAGLKIYWPSVRDVLPFSISLAYTSAIWICLTQLDKLVLSTVLTLEHFGYFTLVIIISNGVLNLASPIGQALLPRMTYLQSQGNTQEMLRLYRTATRLMVTLIFTVTGLIALFPEKLLYALTGNLSAANWAGPVLAPYVLGTGILTVSAFQYYLQFAVGNLRLHIISSSINAVLQAPLLIYMVVNYGAQGAAYTWLALRLISFFIWPAIVHRKYAPGIHFQWLLRDVLPHVLMTALLLYLTQLIWGGADMQGRLQIIVLLITASLLIIFTNVLMMPTGRRYISDMFMSNGK